MRKMKKETGFSDSYYFATANTIASYNELGRDISADVCIIGGGMTGTNAAIELRKKGMTVVLLEASQIAFGGSGRSGGQALVGFNLGLRDLNEAYGQTEGKRLWDLSTESIDIIRERINEFDIACDFQQGYIKLALSKGQEEELKSWFDLKMGRYDYPYVEWWNKDKINEVANTERYLGGLFDNNSGHLHSLNYTLGLADGAKKLGADIYEHTPALKIEKGKGFNLIKTPKGSVKATQVLLACNAYLNGLHRRAQSTIIPFVSYIGVTEKLRKNHPITNKMAMSDLNNCFDYYHPTADGRLLFGGVTHPFNGEYSDSQARLQQRLLKVFPQLANVKMEYHWGGLLAGTRTQMPEIAHLGNDIYTAHGYTGHGVGLTNIAGRVVAEAMVGQAGRFDVFGRIKQGWIPTPKLLRKPALALAIWKAQLEDALAK